jgi:predicted nuclease of predicted toxin-antitoxin system
VKFWMDENVPKKLSRALTQAGHEAIRTPKGYSDPVVLRLALEAGAVLVQ